MSQLASLWNADTPGADLARHLGHVAAVADLAEAEAGGLAGADAADLQVATGRQAEGVVEIDLVALAAAAGVVAGGPGRTAGRRPARRRGVL
jgi:hypothetical protein